MSKISKILIGTHNKGKFKELSYLLPENLKKITPKSIGIRSPKETGKTFEANAKLKVKYFSMSDSEKKKSKYPLQSVIV